MCYNITIFKHIKINQYKGFVMKKSCFFLLVFSLLGFFLGCSSYVNPGYQDGKFTVKDAGGRQSPSEFIRNKEQESRLLTTQEFNNQKQLALSQKNLNNLRLLKEIEEQYYLCNKYSSLYHLLNTQLSNASAYVTIGYDDDDNIQVTGTGGRLSPRQFLYLKELEESLNSLQTLEKQFRQLLKEQDFKFAYKFTQSVCNLSLISDPSNPRTPNSTLVFLPIRNNSSRIIKITSGPSKDYVINPGNSTKEEKAFWSGYYKMEYTVMKLTDSKNPKDKKITIDKWSRKDFIDVPEDRTAEIIIN